MPLLASLGSEAVEPGAGGLPSGIQALAVLRPRPGRGGRGGNVVTVPGRDGWVTLHASKLDPTGDVASRS